MKKADSILENSTLGLAPEEKKPLEVHNYEINPELMVGTGRARSTGGGSIVKNPFDEVGIHVADPEQVRKAAKIIKEKQEMRFAQIKEALKSLNSPQAKEAVNLLESENPEEVQKGKEMLKPYGYNEEGFTIN